MRGTEAEARKQSTSEEGGAERASTPSSLRQTLGLLSALAGLLVALATCACGPMMAVLATATGEEASSGPAIQQALALTVLGMGLGMAIAVEGWRTWQGRPSPPFHPQRPWILWMVLLPLLAAGLLISLLDLAPAYLLPPINTFTMLLLPALILGMVGHALGGAGGSWRDVVGGLVSGASLGTGLAVLIEVSLLVVLAVGALALGLLPEELSSVESWGEPLGDPTLLSDPQALLDLLTPGMVAVILLFIAVLTPLAEEVTKTLGVGLAGAWLRPGPARAFLLGTASGAGFALAENLLNGAVIGTLWGPGILSRLAATLMHCATGGLMGWGWGELWAGKHPWRLVLAFAGAVVTHGVWNGLAVGAALGGLLTASDTGDPAWMAAVSLATMAMAALLLLIATATLAGMVWAARRLGRGTA